MANIDVEHIHGWIANASSPSERVNCSAFKVLAQQDEVIIADKLTQWRSVFNGENQADLLQSHHLKLSQLEQSVKDVEVVDSKKLPRWAEHFFQLMNRWQTLIDQNKALAHIDGLDKKLFCYNFGLLARDQLNEVIAKLAKQNIIIKEQAIVPLLNYFISRLYAPLISLIQSCYFTNAISSKNANVPIDYNSLEFWIGCLDKQPVIARLLGTINADWLETSEEMLMRFANDTDFIAEHFLQASTQESLTILNINPGLGDPHRGGRSVAIIQTNQGDVVYKPKNLSGTESIGKLLNSLHDINSNCVPLTPKFANQGQYGWEQKVVAKTCTTQAEVATFYKRLGAWLRLLQVLNANDFWYDNLIACADMPYFIDYETIVGTPPMQENDIYLLSNIGILPRMMPDQDNGSPIDISCMVAPGKQRTPIKYGNADQQIALEAVDFAVHLNGKFESINPYFEDFLAGFRAINQLLLSTAGHRALMTFLTDIKQARFRHISIDTWSAYSLISEVNSQCCRDGVRQEIAYHQYLFAKLKAYPFHIIDSALKSIKRNDIPIYEIDTASTNVYTCDNKISNGMHTDSVSFYIKKNIKRLDEVEQDISIVKTLYSIQQTPVKPSYQVQDLLKDYNPLTLAEQIAKVILSRMDEHKPDLNLAQVTYTSFLKYDALTGLSRNFSGAVGLIIFFKRLYEFNQDSCYHQALSWLHQFLKTKPYWTNRDYGAMSDYVAQIVAYHQLADYFDTQEAMLDSYNALLDLLRNQTELLDDYGLGISGTLAMLEGLSEQLELSRLNHIIAKKPLKKPNHSSWLKQYLTTVYPDNHHSAKLLEPDLHHTLITHLTTDKPSQPASNANINVAIYLGLNTPEHLLQTLLAKLPQDLNTASTQEIIDSLYHFLYLKKYTQHEDKMIQTLSLALINRFATNQQWFCDSWAQDEHLLSAIYGLVDIGFAFLAQHDNTQVLNIARLPETSHYA